MSALIDMSALTSVVVAGVVLGAGLPALFATGVKVLIPPAGATTVSAGRKTIAAMCFGVCVLAVLAGVALMAYGGHS